MARKKSSVERIVSAMQGKTLAELHALNHYRDTKNYNKIRDILGKPNLSDKSALGQARWASQYISIISEPTILEARLVRKDFNVILTSDTIQNLNSISGKSKLTKSQKISIQQLMKKKVVKLSTKSALTPPSFNFNNNLGKPVPNLEIIKKNLTQIDEFNFRQHLSTLRKPTSVNNCRIFVGVKLRDSFGKEVDSFISTKVIPISQLRSEYQRIRQDYPIGKLLRTNVSAKYYYSKAGSKYYMLSNDVYITEVNEIRVLYYM